MHVFGAEVLFSSRVCQSSGSAYKNKDMLEDCVSKFGISASVIHGLGVVDTSAQESMDMSRFIQQPFRHAFLRLISRKAPACRYKSVLVSLI